MRIGWILFIVLVWSACSDEKAPEELMPEMTVYAAKDILRNSALLSGKVVAKSGVTVTSCHFICTPSGTGGEPVRVSVERQGEQVEAVVSGLKANQTYSYCLEVSNGVSKATSQPVEFVTQPNVQPVLGEMVLVGKGPVSATVQCTLTDDGGLTAQVGFRIKNLLTGAMLEIIGEKLTDGVFKGKKTDLAQNSSFAVYAYASNELGETRSGEISFETRNAAYVMVPGTLKDQLDGEVSYQLSDLTVAGMLNGTDIRLLRDLLGRGSNGEATPGTLKRLDLYDTEIVEGGSSYIDSRYTANHTLGTAMFKDCISLEELVLPQTVLTIEKDALEGCISLTSLHLPSSVITFTPSGGCRALTGVTVAALNTAFSSKDGVLYNKSGSKLLFYPEGRTAAAFTIPSTVKMIGGYAFRNSPATKVVIPSSVETLEPNAFYASLIEEVDLTDAMNVIPYAAFQSCGRLAKVTLGAATTLLSEYCFDGCPLRDIYLLADYPPTCRATAFTSQEVFQQAVVHVLPGCKDLYRLSNSWKSFQNFKEDVVIE